ncbi:hypothetical protein C8Q79DRAFT_921914 [Trametes meyenii]|nr:hypothetical protein C8Q79DRAFT_921914 [Trametes meyenii]
MCLSFTSFCIKGLAKDNSGQPVNIEIPRELPEMPDHSAPFTIARCYSAPSPKDSETSANETAAPLILQIGKSLSNEGELTESSGNSIVYEVEAVSQNGIQLPPIVAKLAKETTGRTLSREAGFYDTLRDLQGVVIPRCYGYFRTFVSLQETYIIPWDTNPDAKTVFPRVGFSVYNLPHPAASLNILLLERLGRPLNQITRLGKYRDSLYLQLEAMVTAVSRFGIVHMDIAGRNVLEASTTPLDPATIDTSHGPYNWRIIDWGCATTEQDFQGNILSRMKYDTEHMLTYELYSAWCRREVEGSEVENDDDSNMG